MELLNDPASVGRLKYIVGGLAVVLAFVFGTSAILLDRRQIELVDRKQRPRTITAEQQRIFIETLEGSPRGPLKMGYLGTNTETYAFAQQIHALLRIAGYDLPPESGGEGALVFGPPPVGIQICSKDPNNPPALVEPLRIAFRAIGIYAERMPTHANEEGVVVFVGLKD